MTTAFWLQSSVMVLAIIGIIRSLRRMPKKFVMVFVIIMMTAMSFIFYMVYFHPDVVIRWADFLHVDIVIEGK